MLIEAVVTIVVLYFVRKYFRGGQCTSKARLDGKTVLITGCNTGIGKETAVDLASRGARIIMACRSWDKMKEAADEVISRSQGASVALYQLDLSSLKSVRKCASEINEKEDKVDILINNAGVMMCPLMRTEDGFEMQFGTNHLGHFLFTNLLLDKIKASGPGSRIITLSSLAHEHGEMYLDDPNFERTPYNRINAYGQSKLANVLFTRELARRLRGTGVTCYSLHPGAVETELSRHVEDMFGPFKGIVMVLAFPFMKILFKRPVDGAQTSITCAVDPTLAGESGKYYSDCVEKQAKPQGRDDVVAKKLWDMSEKMVGLTAS